MERKHFVTWGIVIVLLLSAFGTASAQSGITPEAPTVAPSESPSAAPTVEPGARFFTHPIVKLLSAYFDIVMPTPTPTVDPNAPTATVDPNAPTPVPTDTSGLGPIGKQIAAYHEAGMGFGMLVKIYAMTQALGAACQAAAAAGGTCTPVSADELVTAFKGGAGMGQLFKQFGKPKLLGVGQVRKALRTQNLQVTPAPQAGSSDSSGNGNGKGKGSKGPKGPKK